MCGIVGYTGWRDATAVVMAGLSRLEYRGYDSAGVAVASHGELTVRKRAGKLGVLRHDLEENPLPEGHTGLGHTRWATHGAPTDVNAHPHLVDAGRLAVVHNGIIENERVLRHELEAEGVRFVSDTDTEVAAALLARHYRALGDLSAAMRATASRLEGAFTLVAVHRDVADLVVAARRDSPLVAGIGDGEVFLASDVAAFAEHTRHAVALGQDQVVEATSRGITVTDLTGAPAVPEPFEVDWNPAAAQKGGWSSFMAKEIDEEPASVTDTLRGRIHDEAVVLPEIDDLLVPGRPVRKILILACGTAFYAGQAARYALEAWAGIPTTVELAHEFRYREPLVEEGTLAITISQSGETMDTLMAARYARERGAATLSICNTQGSSIPRESDAVLYTHAGPEVAVASTKAFSAQVVALLLTALDLARRSGRPVDQSRLITCLRRIPGQIRTVLDTQQEAVDRVADTLAPATSLFLLGRNVLLPVAREGALKLKETSYLHAEAFPAGELKHGPIALIEPGRPVIALAPLGGTLLGAKMDSTVQELRSRGAEVTVIGQEGGTVPASVVREEAILIPHTDPLLSPILAVVPLHMLAMAVAGARGVDVDQPRNLAKSVTVE